MAGSTYGDSAIVSGSIKIINEVATPSPSSGEAYIYVKNDGKLYFRSGDEGETDLLSGGGGGGGGDGGEGMSENEIVGIQMLSG